MSLVAFILIILYTKAEHFQISHARLGLFIIILSLVNPIVGLVADLMYDSSRSHTPILPDIAHWVIGWLLLMCAVVNVLLGLSRFEFAPGYAWALYFVAAFTILFANCGFLVVNVAQGTSHFCY